MRLSFKLHPSQPVNPCIFQARSLAPKCAASTRISLTLVCQDPYKISMQTVFRIRKLHIFNATMHATPASTIITIGSVFLSEFFWKGLVESVPAVAAVDGTSVRDLLPACAVATTARVVEEATIAIWGLCVWLVLYNLASMRTRTLGGITAAPAPMQKPV